MKKLTAFILILCLSAFVNAEDGHDLWLRAKVAKPVKVLSPMKSAMIQIAVRELEQNWQGKPNAKVFLKLVSDQRLETDGFRLTETSIEARTQPGILYGVFELLRRQKTGQQQKVTSNPSYQHRILNHWDNLNGSIERGYSGNSIFWRQGDLKVTDFDINLWKEYARANASIGINGSVLNNVNSSPRMLSSDNLARLKAIADVLRPYGITTYLSVNFASPKALGGLNTADPLDAAVVQWWTKKVSEIYGLVPDFGGFLVKANSEGQPGPQDFGRTHAEGANMLADILKPKGGLVMWRAFVYSSTDKDRARQAYTEFKPLDGQFRDNVIIQVKNGPVDFQPREPFSPLFGAMKKTAVMPELQITQEYLGHSYQLAFLSTMWEELLKSDTYQEGKGSTVARVTDGSILPQKYSAIAGVANVGLDKNWTGHPFAQANWYAFGRLAWDNLLSSEQIADEWLRLTFPSADDSKATWENKFLQPVKQMMLESREAVVNYSMPLGLHHIFSAHEHYGPGPWWAPKNVRVDWTPPYYHKVDSLGIGFDRTTTGSNAVSQYHEPLASQFNSPQTCPEIYLLWFHHLPWNYKMKSGRTLWDEICLHYDKGLKKTRAFQATWEKVQPYVDTERFSEVQARLKRQTGDAQVWKDACILYFQKFSGRAIPQEVERPVYDLDYLIKSNPLLINK